MRVITKPITILFTAVLATLTVAGCTQVQEPWKSGNAYEHERMRAPDTAQELDHRLRYTQTDR